MITKSSVSGEHLENQVIGHRIGQEMDSTDATKEITQNSAG